jgi:hypothetical protein
MNAQRFPVWASLARDYLSIMASSVSSEQAFSSAGITISKRWNRLKGDIVEALQFLKCTIHKNLLFHEPGPSSALEMDEHENENEGEVEDVEPLTWDTIIEGDVDALNISDTD